MNASEAQTGQKRIGDLTMRAIQTYFGDSRSDDDEARWGGIGARRGLPLREIEVVVNSVITATLLCI